MPWVGSSFQRLFSWTQDKANGLNIIAQRMDDDTDDITGNGFNNCLTRDGQGGPIGDLPMGNFKHTGVGNANARNQYAVVGQVQDASYLYAAGTGTGDAIVATFAPPITALVNGMTVWTDAPGANTLTNPTFRANATTILTIKKQGGLVLTAGQYATGQRLQLSYVSAGPYWELVSVGGTGTIANNTVLGNISGGAASPIGLTASQVLDTISTTQGTILYRNATIWTSLAPGTSAGQFLRTLGAAANPIWDAPNLREQLITANGNFTVPTTATAATVFRFLAIAGGGGGGNATTNSGAAGAGGSAGCEVIAEFRGFTAGQNFTVVIGTGGASAAGGNDTTLTYAAVNIVTAKGGLNGHSSSVAAAIVSTTEGAVTGNVATAGASGLTLVWTNVVAGTAPTGTGGIAVGGSFSGWGANSSLGVGGTGLLLSGNGTNAVGIGAGGGGALRAGSDVTGGTGANGAVLVTWVLP